MTGLVNASAWSCSSGPHNVRWCTVCVAGNDRWRQWQYLCMLQPVPGNFMMGPFCTISAKFPLPTGVSCIKSRKQWWVRTEELVWKGMKMVDDAWWGIWMSYISTIVKEDEKFCSERRRGWRRNDQEKAKRSDGQISIYTVYVDFGVSMKRWNWQS